MNSPFAEPRSPSTDPVAADTSALSREAAINSPEQVVDDSNMTLAEKRAILAAWASDSHAVENAPTLRRLDSGAVVSLDEILAALRALDERRLGPSGPGILYRFPFARHQSKLTARWRSLGRRPRGRHDDDDDPPPAPSAAAPIPKRPQFVAAYGQPVRPAARA